MKLSSDVFGQLLDCKVVLILHEIKCLDVGWFVLRIQTYLHGCAQMKAAPTKGRGCFGFAYFILYVETK